MPASLVETLHLTTEIAVDGRIGAWRRDPGRVRIYFSPESSFEIICKAKIMALANVSSKLCVEGFPESDSTFEESFILRKSNDNF